MRLMSCLTMLFASTVAMASSPAQPEGILADEAVQAAAEEGKPETTEAWQKTGFGFGGIPAVNYNSDEGVGFGAALSIYKYNGKTQPYKSAVDVLLFATSKNIHHHRVKYDFLELAGGKLRLTGRVKFEASRVENYCGLGGGVTCDAQAAEDKADEQGLEGDDREDFVRRYYRARYVMPYATINGRWMFSDKPHRVSLLAGYRFNYLLPGDLGTKENYPGSLYDQDYPDGESGALSVAQLGVQIDNRRNEAAPYDGYLAEVAIRGSSKYWGSNPDWQYFGFTIKGQGYLPLGKDDGHLVLAERMILDGIVGDTAMRDLPWAGGAGALSMGGSLDSGRGIRQRRFRGRAKYLSQTELRFRYGRLKLGESVLDFGVLGFADVGLTGLEWSDFGKDAPMLGAGGGLRFTLNQNFVIRADVGVSPVEDWSPSVYIDLGNTF